MIVRIIGILIGLSLIFVILFLRGLPVLLFLKAIPLLFVFFVAAAFIYAGVTKD